MSHHIFKYGIKNIYPNTIFDFHSQDNQDICRALILNHPKVYILLICGIIVLKCMYI